MDLDWSEQSLHIRGLYRPWQEGDGYEESIIAAAEARLHARLPAVLRTFYRAWGQREDMTRLQHFLLGPVGLYPRPDALIFCQESQGCCWWAIERQVLAESDPPVVIADPENRDRRDLHAPLTWKASHARLSDFLDRLTYEHAFCGGAMHGGYSPYAQGTRIQKFQLAWLEQHWELAKTGSEVLGEADAKYDERLFWVRDGQALVSGLYGWNSAARDREALEEIGQELGITWEWQW
jgi:hypothetical protein